MVCVFQIFTNVTVSGTYVCWLFDAATPVYVDVLDGQVAHCVLCNTRLPHDMRDVCCLMVRQAWVLVLQYLRQAGTTPSLRYLTTSFPQCAPLCWNLRTTNDDVIFSIFSPRLFFLLAKRFASDALGSDGSLSASRSDRVTGSFGSRADFRVEFLMSTCLQLGSCGSFDARVAFVRFAAFLRHLECDGACELRELRHAGNVSSPRA